MIRREDSLLRIRYYRKENAHQIGVRFCWVLHL